MRSFAIPTVLALAVLAIGCDSSSPPRKLTLPAIFSDNAVLQQGITLPVWGWDKPGKEVTVVLAGQRRITRAGPGGKWLVKFSPFPAGGPHTLTVHGSGRLDRTDLLFGEVWLCAGGEGMAMPLKELGDGQRQARQATWPDIRLFSVPRRRAEVTQWNTQGRWRFCSPNSAADFSAIGYFLARDLHETLGVPVGVIDASWAGTPIAAWTPRRALARRPVYASRLDAVDTWVRAWRNAGEDPDVAYQNLMSVYLEQMEHYLSVIDRRDPGGKGRWAQRELNAEDWPQMTLPGWWESQALAGLDGVVWLRKTVQIPPEWAGRDLSLHLGRIDQADRTFFNGEIIGSTQLGENDPAGQERHYTIPGPLVQPGTNLLAVRVLDLGGRGGWDPNSPAMTLAPKGAPQDQAIDLGGDWKYKVALRIDTSGAPVRPEKTSQPGRRLEDPAGIYNGMIAPLVPYGLAGTAWYQGRADLEDPENFRSLLPTLIQGWRHEWKQAGGFHWGIIQLPRPGQRASVPNPSSWPALRDAQFTAAKRLRETGLIVTFDAWSAGSGPAPDRRLVGRRLSLWALESLYGAKTVGSGPVYLAHRFEEGRIRVRFTHIGGGLVSPTGQLEGFALAGADRKFHPAQARIEGRTIVVGSGQVPNPEALRYGWSADAGKANLYNREGLPASPFRTDDWPLK